MMIEVFVMAYVSALRDSGTASALEWLLSKSHLSAVCMKRASTGLQTTKAFLRHFLI